MKCSLECNKVSRFFTNQINTNITTTNSPLLNFSHPSEPNSSDSPATSASPRPKVELVSGPLASLVMETSEAPPSLGSCWQEEVVETLNSSTNRQQSVEGDRQADSMSELLGYDRQAVGETKSQSG